MLRIIRWVATALCAALLLLWVATWLGYGGPGGSPLTIVQRLTGLRLGAPDAREAGVVLPAGLSLGGPFQLTDQTGKRVSDADFRGRWMLLYFGYTTCPDVCPTELQTMTGALDTLGAKAERVVPVFVTVDPDRDTAAV